MNQKVDVYKIVSGQYRSNDLVAQIEIKNPTFPTEILEFCNENNVMISLENEDILICRDTKQAMYFIK